MLLKETPVDLIYVYFFVFSQNFTDNSDYFSCTLIITFIVVSRLSSMYWYAFR